MSAKSLALRHDARKAAGFRDAIGRPCAQCAVATINDPAGACRYYEPAGLPCVVAKGRYRRTLRSALPIVKEKLFLEPSVDRYALLCGQIEQSKVERAALLSAGKSVDEVDTKLTELHRQASKAMREAGLGRTFPEVANPNSTRLCSDKPSDNNYNKSGLSKAHSRAAGTLPLFGHGGH